MKRELCNHLPLMTAEELAKVYYITEHMAKEQWGVSITDDGYFVPYLKHMEKDKKIDVLGHTCPFYKDGCALEKEDLMPTLCKQIRTAGEIKDNLFNTVSVVRSLMGIDPDIVKINITGNKYRQMLKDLDKDVIYYYIISKLLNRDLSGLNLTFNKNYKLAIIQDSNSTRVSAICIHHLDVNEPLFKSDNLNNYLLKFIKGLNRLTSRMTVKPYDYHKLLVDTINRKVGGLQDVTVSEDLVVSAGLDHTDSKVIGALTFIVVLLLTWKVFQSRKHEKVISNYFKELDNRSYLLLAVNTYNKLIGKEEIPTFFEALKVFNNIKDNDELFKALLKHAKNLARAITK